MFPVITHIVQVIDLISNRMKHIGQLHIVGTNCHTTKFRISLLVGHTKKILILAWRSNNELIKMSLFPSHRHLYRRMKIKQSHVALYVNNSPDQRIGVQETNFEDEDGGTAHSLEANQIYDLRYFKK